MSDPRSADPSTTATNIFTTGRPTRRQIERVAGSMGVDESFVEKDWCVVRILEVISRLTLLGGTLIFSGGTSLSKGHGLIQRFSEDIDFKARLHGLADLDVRSARRALRSGFRAEFIAGLLAGGVPVEDQRVAVKDEGGYFSIEIDYAPSSDLNEALRPHVLIEVTTAEPTLPTVPRPIASFLSGAARRAPEVAAIDCVDAVETAADKLSALAWRVLDRSGQDTPMDRTLVRHLHDLAALERVAAEDSRFADLVLSQLTKDALRGRRRPEGEALPPRPTDPAALFIAMAEALRSDQRYEEEYRTFVERMSYARVAETPSFDGALAAVDRLTRAISIPTASRA